MKTARLGNTDLEFTRVGLGTWAIGGSWQFGWGEQDKSDSIKTIHEAMDAGINWLDTAPIYGCGTSEEVVGKGLKGVSQKPFIATKCGLIWNERQEKSSCLKRKSIIAECDASLGRLGVEVIDLYQIHWPGSGEDIEEAYEAMVECVKAGKVRYLGVSNFSISQMQRVMEIAPLASSQPSYSMLYRDVEKEILGFCGENNIGIVSYSPMQKGLLAGKFTLEKIKALDAADHRHRDRNFIGSRFEQIQKLIAELQPIAERSGLTMAQLAIAWVLRRSEVTSAIVGARRGGQIYETAAAGDVELSETDVNAIDELLRQM
ncbi:MAG: aldo/keto reductase [Anaerohalosphaeraceae bacterium]|nr:aldo/keto reductase [Anaerohalosphaeraceae bacterium]